MKYRLSLLIGCLAVLLGVFTFVACNKKDKDATESGNSIVGKWIQEQHDSYYGTTFTVTLQFNNDHTGTYTYMYDGENYPQTFHYTYDPATCTGTVLMYDIEYGNQIESTFKLTWYGENTINISIYNEDYGEWYSIGTFTREGGSSGGATPSGDTYSIIGTWKHSETSYYYNITITTTITFNADGTGKYIYEDGGGDRLDYNVRYNYNQTTCIGDMLIINPDPVYGSQYQMKFKVKWYGANTALIYVADEDYYYGDIDWEEMGVFERQ